MTDRARGWALVGGQFALLGALVLVPIGRDWDVPAWVRTIGTVGRIAGATATRTGRFLPRPGPST